MKVHFQIFVLVFSVFLTTTGMLRAEGREGTTAAAFEAAETLAVEATADYFADQSSPLTFPAARTLISDEAGERGTVACLGASVFVVRCGDSVLRLPAAGIRTLHVVPGPDVRIAAILHTLSTAHVDPFQLFHYRFQKIPPELAVV